MPYCPFQGRKLTTEAGCSRRLRIVQRTAHGAHHYPQVPMPVISSKPSLKRLLDIGVIVLAAPVVLPMLAATMCAVRIAIGSPIFYAQSRPGVSGQLFVMFKFRTMSNARDARGELLPDDQRLGRFGRALRSTSLDELPELWNVLKGDMSLVGPRPLLPEYLPLYTKQQMRRHEVRPGITGWAQINGRNAVAWDQKFDLDVWYVDNRTLGLDIKILFKTLRKVIARSEISARGEATASRFEGSVNQK